jgi:predicted ABC-type exoprotein transport system permease subunit
MEWLLLGDYYLLRCAKYMSAYFRKSILISFFYHMFLFAFTLSAGYLVSVLLKCAIEQDIAGTLTFGGILLTLLLTGLPAIYA